MRPLTLSASPIAVTEGAYQLPLTSDCKFTKLEKGKTIMRRIIIALLLCACAGATFAQSVTPTPAPTPAQESPKRAPVAKNDYSNGDDWLCRPGRQDACATDLATTIIAADGKETHEDWTANQDAGIDCFYVYPTVSTDPGGNSTMTLGLEERAVAHVQFARFGSRCRVYAPLYRQVTLTALRAALSGSPIPVDRALAYDDVLDAWNYYLEHDNHGRGVVLIGHSQGSSVLTALIRNEIDGKPVQSRVISALLLGTSLPVPKGKDVGGAFQHMPLCHAANQTGCVITYASFRATSPPPANSHFGKVTGEGMISACTNPAALGGGSGELHSYLRTNGSGIVSAAEAAPGPWVKDAPPITTPFVSVPGMLTAECIAKDSASYLAITVHGDPAGPRVSDIKGDVVVGGQVLADWGLHLIDVNLAMGNLLDIVGQQSKAYLGSAPKK
jgi:pimeloyl-ACP methyl ester carboxylesterase